MTEGQRRALFAHLSRTGLGKEELKEFIGISSLKDLSKKEASQVIDWLAQRPSKKTQDEGATRPA